MAKYSVIITEQVIRDTEEAIFYKESLGTYKNHVSEFSKRVIMFVKQLESTPNIGLDLSEKISISTNIKYSIIDDYILFYEISDLSIHVLRLLPSKSNWMNTILKTK